MNNVKRITTDIPEDLLKEATQITQKSIPETLIVGLELILRTRAYEKA